MPGSRAALLVGAFFLLAAAPASAAERFASPTGTGAACSAATPCALSTALSGFGGPSIANRNTVTLRSGVYTVAHVEVPSNVNLRGEPGQPRPIIRGSLSATLTPYELVNGSQGATFTHLEIEVTGAAGGIALWVDSQSGGDLIVDDVAVTSTRDGMLIQGQGTVRNTMVRSTKPGGGYALQAQSKTGTVRLLGVTALGPDAGTAIRARGETAGAPSRVELINTVARGQTDLRAEKVAGGTLTVALTSSAVRAAKQTLGAGSPVIDPISRLEVANLPLDSAGRPPAGSPLIDAGTVVPDLGLADLDGRARLLGPLPDVGAYEYETPLLPSGPGAGAPPPASEPAPAPGPAASASAPVTAGDVRAPKLKLLGSSKLTRKALKRGITVTVEVDEGATLRATLTRKDKKKTSLATARGTATKAGKVKLKLKVPARKLAGTKRLTATLRMTAADTTGNVSSVDRRVTIS